MTAGLAVPVRLGKTQQIVCAVLAATLVSAGPALAQGAQGSAPRIVDKGMGEAEQIERRTEWLYESRRAGTSSGAEMARLRAAAVEKTRAELKLQRLRQDATEGSGQSVWVSKGPAPSTFGGWSFGTVAGRISSIAADWAGGTLYVGTASGGLWKSTNDGASYTPIFDSAGTLTVGTVAVDPNDAAVVWVGTGENGRGCESYFGIGLLRSPDGGGTWEARNGSGLTRLDELSTFANVIIDPRDSNHIVTGGRLRGCGDGDSLAGAVYSTNDGGATWTKRLDDLEVFEIAQDPVVLDTLWAGTGNGVYKSTDFGVTWVLQTASGLPTDSGRTEIAIAPSDPDVVYALFSGGGRSFWRTTDGGASWSQMATGNDACDGQCSYNMVLRVHRNRASEVYRGTIRIFKSTDAGSNWSALTDTWGSSQEVHQDTHHLLMHPTDHNTFYVGSDGGVWKTVNGGASFINKNGNINATQFYAIGIDVNDPDVICGGAQDNSSLARTTSDVWALQAVTGDGFICHIDPVSPNRTYVTSYPWQGYPSLLRSTGGLFGSFTQLTGAGSGVVGSDREYWVTPHLLDPTSPNVLYLGTQRVYRSDDWGSSWTPTGPSDMTFGAGALLSLEINRNFPTVLYAGSTDGRLWRTENSGDDWVDITAGLPEGYWINDVASDPTDPDRAIALVGGFNVPHVHEWNAGSGWTARGLDLPNVPANTVLMMSGTDLLVGMDTGVFRSLDGGVTFEPYMNGLPLGAVVTDLELDLQRSLVTAGTYGRGAWQAYIDPVAANIQYDSVELPMLQVDGDGDSKIEPGETWTVRPVLRNVGGELARNVTAGLATAAPGITVLNEVTQFGDIAPAQFISSPEGFTFTVDPGFPCGDEVVFDLVNIASTLPALGFPDVPGAFSVTVVGLSGDPSSVSILAEDFGGEVTTAWTWQSVGSGGPEARPALWQRTSRSVEGGGRFFAGGDTRSGQAWLHHSGTDSAGGAGIELPADARSIQLAVVHRYDIRAGGAGHVVIDPVMDGADDYTALKPLGREDKAFEGTSDGWQTSVFDLTRYKGRRVYLAFVYGGTGASGETRGWTIDEVKMEFLPLGGPAFCTVTEWPGSVPENALFGRAGSDVEATWGDSCNNGDLLQSYAIHAGDLDALVASGTYSHTPVNAGCDLASPAGFTPGPGNEYYLIVPNAEGREGGLGAGVGGAPRPQVSSTCGIPRAATCF